MKCTAGSGPGILKGGGEGGVQLLTVLIMTCSVCRAIFYSVYNDQHRCTNYFWPVDCELPLLYLSQSTKKISRKVLNSTVGSSMLSSSKSFI